jgi:hypothetical protein
MCTMFTSTTIEHCHRFVGTTRLQLHVICTCVWTLWTDFWRFNYLFYYFIIYRPLSVRFAKPTDHRALRRSLLVSGRSYCRAAQELFLHNTSFTHTFRSTGQMYGHVAQTNWMALSPSSRPNRLPQFGQNNCIMCIQDYYKCLRNHSYFWIFRNHLSTCANSVDINVVMNWWTQNIVL